MEDELLGGKRRRRRKCGWVRDVGLAISAVFMMSAIVVLSALLVNLKRQCGDLQRQMASLQERVDRREASTEAVEMDEDTDAPDWDAPDWEAPMNHSGSLRAIAAAHFEPVREKAEEGGEYYHNFDHDGASFVHNYWKSADWMRQKRFPVAAEMDHQKQAVVQESGLYLVYAQVWYKGDYPTTGYHAVFANQDILTQCVAYHDDQLPGSCVAVGVFELKAKTRLSVRQPVDQLAGTSRESIEDTTLIPHVSLKKTKTSFGLIRIA